MDPQFKSHLDELFKAARVADKIDKERAEQFIVMQRTEGWRLFQELVGLRIQLFADAIMLPAGSVDAAIALEYVKGAMSGLIIARDLPSVIVGAMKASVPAADGEDDDD